MQTRNTEHGPPRTLIPCTSRRCLSTAFHLWSPGNLKANACKCVQAREGCFDHCDVLRSRPEDTSRHNFASVQPSFCLEPKRLRELVRFVFLSCVVCFERFQNRTPTCKKELPLTMYCFLLDPAPPPPKQCWVGVHVKLRCLLFFSHALAST